tara:strand:- start:49974 stop:51149 length:1176 start_codon:yes stop_codon:yes gene_type:complete
LGVVTIHEHLGKTYLNKQGNTLTVVGYVKNDTGRGYKLTVTCSKCSEDKELFPDPFPILYSKLKAGRSPCGCTRIIYTEDQIKILAKRKAKELGHTFLGFTDEFVSNRVTDLIIKCPHEIKEINCHLYLNYSKHGCNSCASERVSESYISKYEYPSCVEEVRSTEVKDYGSRYHEYKCSVCSYDWYVVNGFCDGWFSFKPCRLSKGIFTCRCNLNYFPKDSDRYNLGRAIKSRLPHKNIKVLDFKGDRILFECSYHGKGDQNSSSCFEGRLPKCCVKNSWGYYEDRKYDTDYLYFVSMEDMENNKYIKIGRSFNLMTRIQDLEDGYFVDLLYLLESPHKDIYKYEKFFHKVFRKYREQPPTYFKGETEVFNYTVLGDKDFKLLVSDFIEGY